ncbi:hypothetical protein L1887_39128 [Cichorium endivia]|nr:hypothetical protein L1887_39128 [Cichorium endivia]
MAESSKGVLGSAVSGPTTVIASCNYQAICDPSKYKEYLQHDHSLTFTLANDVEVTMDKKTFADALKIPYHERAVDPFYSPTNDEFHQVQLLNELDDVPLERAPIKAYSPKFDHIFGKVRRLSEAFLQLGDPESTYVKKHLEATKGVEKYRQGPIKQAEPSKKGKKRGGDQSPENPKSKKSKPILVFAILGVFLLFDVLSHKLSSWDVAQKKQPEKQNRPTKESKKAEKQNKPQKEISLDAEK